MMAPPGRSRKAGTQRIDAAYAALVPFGFTKDQIRKTVRNLLKVYGGGDGWYFIEEASYKLVIDTLLEQQEDEGTENMEIDDADPLPDLPATEDVSGAIGETSLIPTITTDYQDIDMSALSRANGRVESEEVRARPDKVASNRDGPADKIAANRDGPAVKIVSNRDGPADKVASNRDGPADKIAANRDGPADKIASNRDGHFKTARLTQCMRAVDIGRSSTHKLNREPINPDTRSPPNKLNSYRDESLQNTRLLQRMRAVEIESASTQRRNKEPTSSVTIESSYDTEPVAQPAKHRPACNGWFSDTESDSEDEF